MKCIAGMTSRNNCKCVRCAGAEAAAAAFAYECEWKGGWLAVKIGLYEVVEETFPL